MSQDCLYKQIGQRIRAQRIRLRMTLEDLADSAARHPTFIGQIERGTKKASLTTLMLLSQALGMSIDEIFQHNFPSRSFQRVDDLHVSALLRSNSPVKRKILISTLRRLSKDLKALR